MTRKDVKGDQPSGGETTWTNTGATRYGRGQHKTGSFGDDMLRPSPNHGTQRLPNDDDATMAFTSRKKKRAQLIALVLLNRRRKQRPTCERLWVPLKMWLKGSVMTRRKSLSNF